MHPHAQLNVSETNVSQINVSQVNTMPPVLHWTGLVFAVTALGVSIGLGGTDGLLPVLAALAVFFALSWLFSEMTIKVDERGVRWAFRRGWFGGSVSIADIREAETSYVSWLYGYGYRWTMRGPLYRAWGLDCVMIHRAQGKPVFLGAADPAALIAAIEAAQAKWLEDTDRA
ncbi:MAG: hypothetical protein MUC58_04205 [Rhizobiaceae bacterium]|jgi:hypothetical protein|nr:hypothetical protein [Rhizobiaceae bacterium]